MKTWLITLSLLCVAALATADGMERPPAAERTGAVAAGDEARPARRGKSGRKAARLPRGDLRHCLELKDNAAIIRCAETRP